MPTYLCHGFRWQRRSVRTYVILQNLDDASPDWIIPAKTSQYILKSFYEIFEFLPYCNPKQGRYSPSREPDSDDDDNRIANHANPKDRSQSRGRGRSGSQSTNQSRNQSQSRARQQPLPPLPAATDDSSSITSEDDFSAQSWSAIKLLEEYDPHDLTAVSRPYAYVADYAVRIDLSCSIVEEIARYEQQQLQSPHPAISIPSRDSPAPSPGWFEELRDQLQKGEELRWYVVVNNDEVRDWPNQPSEPSIPRPEPGYQPYQVKPYKPQQQQSYQCQYQYQSQPGRAMPTREQRHHHAQYLHQQRIFEGADQEKEQGQQQSPDRSDQDPKREQQHQQQQPQQLVFEKSEQQGKLEEEKRRQQLLFERSEQQRKQEEEKRQQRLLLERNEQQRKREQQQQALARKEQELRVEQERQRQREIDKEKERERQREWDRRLEEEREKQRAQKARLNLNGANSTSKPPMVPAKDYNFPLPPTANAYRNANASIPRLRPKMSLDAGLGRPKTPGSKGGGLRRLFGRGKLSVDEGPYSP